MYAQNDVTFYFVTVSSLSSGKQSVQISVNDRVSVFLELAEAHRVLGEQVRGAVVLHCDTSSVFVMFLMLLVA